MTLITARIPELPRHVDEIALGDKIPLWIAANNKTRHVNAGELRSWLITGGGATITPVISGGEMIHRVPAIEDGTDTVSIPSIAGKSFTLEIDGEAMIPQQNPTIAQAEFEILAGGGFKLLGGRVVYENQKCKLIFFGSISPSNQIPGGDFIKGNVVVNTNYTLDVANDLNKLIQIRSDATQITLTLPSVADIPVHKIIPIEATINNSVQNKITTTGGQYIYFNNDSKTSVYVSPGETIWLYRGADGFYVINDFGSNYKNLAKPFASFKIDLNTLVCKGQLLSRVLYPRLWEYVQTLGASLVTDAVWSTNEVYLKDGAFYTSPPAAPYETIEKPYKGCYSTGDGSTTFRVPDLMGSALRGLISETGTDPLRYLNKGGGFQQNMNKIHTHGVDTSGNQSGVDPIRSLQRSSTNGDGYTNGGGIRDLVESSGGGESIMNNIGVLWLINY